MTTADNKIILELFYTVGGIKVNKNESTEMINNRFLNARTIEDVDNIDKEYRSKRTTVRAEVERLCDKYSIRFSSLPELIGCKTSTFYSRINEESKITKGFIIELAFAIKGITLEELTELFKIANVGKLDAKRKVEDKYVLMFFGRNSDSKEGNKSDYGIWELEQLLKEKVAYKEREIIFSITRNPEKY